MSKTKIKWRKTAVAGLYERRPAGLPATERGVYFSRFSLNGSRTFRSLKTSVFDHARIRHAKRMAEVETDRSKGRSVAIGFRTLGELLGEMRVRLAAEPAAENTKLARHGSIERLRKHWRRGDFDSFPARSCTVEVIADLRDYLQQHAPWRYHFGRPRHGFSPAVVGQTLWVLNVLMRLAVEKGVVSENPFSIRSVLRGRLDAGSSTRRRSLIPSRPDMMRVLAEMRRVPPASNNFRANPEQRRHLASVATELADHAELLAFSGMRKGEAQSALIEDDTGATLRIRGTKSESSARTIPVNPALRAVLDRIKSRRPANGPLLVTAEPGRALKRACVRCGLPSMRNHDLRHFFASACIASGVDVPTVSRWLGHADGGALAMKTYGHLLEDHSAAAAQKLNFSGEITPPGKAPRSKRA